jgi:transforming growth factor-beta-induced protein
VLSYDLADGTILSMLNGENITVSVDAVGLSLSSEFTESARVTEADLVAKNGVLHKIDNVLLPRFVFTDLIGLGNTAAGAEYSVLFSLFESLDIGSIIRAAGDVTVFAPTDTAFLALGNDTLDALRSDTVGLTAILANHVVQGVVPLAQMRNDTPIRSLGGLELLLAVSKSPAGRSSVAVNEASIVAPDVVASNGIIHGVDKVLLATQ